MLRHDEAGRQAAATSFSAFQKSKADAIEMGPLLVYLYLVTSLLHYFFLRRCRLN